jgi:hypothetical protein
MHAPSDAGNQTLAAALFCVQARVIRTLNVNQNVALSDKGELERNRFRLNQWALAFCWSMISENRLPPFRIMH